MQNFKRFLDYLLHIFNFTANYLGIMLSYLPFYENKTLIPQELYVILVINSPI